MLDYDNVQQTLVPLMARAYALVFMVRPQSWLGNGPGLRCCCSTSAAPCPAAPCALPCALPCAHPPPCCLWYLSSIHHPPAGAPQGRSMMAMYDSFDAARARGDFGVLPELHALSSGLKALCTDVATAGIEACRRTCGGHGYMLASGLPTLVISFVQNVTWEGENSGAPGWGGAGWAGWLGRRSRAAQGRRRGRPRAPPVPAPCRPPQSCTCRPLATW